MKLVMPRLVNARGVLLGALFGFFFGGVAVPVTSTWLHLDGNPVVFYFIVGMFACIILGALAGSRIGVKKARVKA